MCDKKVLVVKHDKGQSFYVSKALLKHNKLFKLFTCVYYNDDKHNLTYYVYHIVPSFIKKRILHRHQPELSEYVLTSCEVFGLLILFMYNIKFLSKIAEKIERIHIYRFHKKAFKYALKNDVDCIIVSAFCGVNNLKLLKKYNKSIKIIFDSTGLNKQIVREILEKEYSLYPDICKNINGVLHYNEKEEKLEIEHFKYFDYCITTGKFSKDIYIGHNYFDENRIYDIFYGADIDNFYYNKRRTASVLRCVYIGNINVLKGIPTLLKAFDELVNDSVELTLIGNPIPSNMVSEKYKNIKFIGYVLHDLLPKVIHDYDIMIFPSLMDGFGLVVVEAMASGIPVICSKNSGACDLIVDGVNGFVIDPYKYTDIVKKIRLINNNRSMIDGLSINARKTAEKYNWDRYYDKYNSIIERIIK